MRKCFVLCSVMLLCTISVGVGAVSKVTTDPNARGSAAASPVNQTADKRLTRKTTYESGYTRLHSVADELTKLTGVSIRAGSSTKDWQIRDIPLVICVKDLPLGKLLSAIADSTHTLLSSQTLDNGEKAYRFYRNKRLQTEIDGKLQAAHRKQYEQIEWAWDAMLQLAKSTEAQKELAKTMPDSYRRMVSNARLLDSLGADAREKVFSGEKITISGTTPTRASALESILIESLDYRNAHRQANGHKPMERPKPEDIATTEAVVAFRAESDAGNTEVWIVTDLKSGDVGGSCVCPLSVYASQIEKLPGLQLPPRPKGEQVADQNSDRPADARLRLLETEQDWAVEPLSEKFKLEAPKGKAQLTFADTITALAKAAGLSIVTEDFLSHTWGPEPEPGGFFGIELAPSTPLKQTLGSWFYSPDDRLLVGWAWSRGLWRKEHRNLVPESLLISLTAKLDTLGTELDDATPILDLTPEQCAQWILGNRDTVWLMRAFRQDRALWQLYDSLSPANKAQARSENGLPLAVLDPTPTVAFLNEKIALEKAEALPSPGENVKTGASELQPLLDLEVMRSAVLRLKTVPATVPCYGDMTKPGGQVWDARLHHSYVMEIEYETDGQKATVSTSDLGLSLPVYSAKREKELSQKLGKPSAQGQRT